jgi:hypothetical protein
MRNLVTAEFISLISPYLSQISQVAIVGGDRSDPEIVELDKIKNLNVTTLGIDSNSDIFLDLNILQNVNLQFDLVISSQVLEHVFDVKNAIQNLTQLAGEPGLLWIACPASNRSHGSPHYFSAGYQPELIANLTEPLGFSIVKKGLIGSKRSYFFTHALRVWPTCQELKRPITGYSFSRSTGNVIVKTLRFLRDIPGRLYSIFLSPKITNEVEYATEMYILMLKQATLGRK